MINRSSSNDLFNAQRKGPSDTAEQRAADIFKKMDVNSDGVVTREEFVSACLEDVNLMQMLTPDSG